MNSGILTFHALAADGQASLLAGLPLVEQLFDHVRETAFFLKDSTGRYLAVNESLVERCGLHAKSDIVGKHPKDIFPAELAARYAAQDERVIRTGRAIIDLLELHWYEKRQAGWCLTTKLPIKAADGSVMGLVGISRDLRAPGDSETIPASLAPTLEYLETHYGDPISPASLAKQAGLPLVRFERLTRRIFRITPGQLISQTRLAAASRLLVDTDQPVVEIAHACGFCDHSAFTRAFRSATGVTPSRFREQRNGLTE
ncbi:MAG TPA: AraC family transcriptional regulator [Candidatus Limnocylindria bacterium]|nr:AraC family transcriptional regulator [Candidatus Limnocylindria bacterium]